jgi:hypothetical protein
MASADKLRHTKVADKSQIAKEFVQLVKLKTILVSLT